MQLILLFVFAFLVRLINLNQSLWLDESIVAKVVRSIPFHLIPTQLSPTDVHPPLYYMTISAWSGIFGTSEIALRFPSILFSLIAGWYVYKMGGKWAAALFLFNPLVIYYSQEARMHMMATMFLSAALYHFLQILKKTPKDLAKPVSILHNNVALFNIFSALALFTFYGSGFFIAAMIVVDMFQGRDLKGRGLWRRFFYLFIGLFVSLVIVSPLLYVQLINSRAGLAELKNWSSALGNVDIKNITLIFVKFATGRLSWVPKWGYYMVVGIPTALVWVFAVFGMKKNKLLAVLFILPLLFGVIVSIKMPMMMYFRFLYLIPVMSILLVSAVIPSEEGIQSKFHNTKKDNYSLDSRLRGNDKVLCTIMFFYLIFSLIYLLLPQFHREDWKSLSEKLQSNTRVYMIIPSSDPISYYRSDVSVFELRTLNKTALPETIDVIPYTSGIYGVHYAEQLIKRGCIKESETNFRGDLLLERWKCLRNA
jgi:uncharacterized membrane protein